MDLSRYQEHYSLSHRLKRYGWYIVNRTLFRLMVTNAMKVPGTCCSACSGQTYRLPPSFTPAAISGRHGISP